MIEYPGSVLSDAVITEMREWIADCKQALLFPPGIPHTTDREVVNAVARCYPNGGVQAFLAAGRAAS